MTRSEDGTESDDQTADQLGADIAALVGLELGKPFTPCAGVAGGRAT